MLICRKHHNYNILFIKLSNRDKTFNKFRKYDKFLVLQLQFTILSVIDHLATLAHN